MENNKYNTVIFDFDGTLADTFGAVIKIINANKERFGIDGIDKFEISQLRDLSMKYLLKEFKLNILTLFKHISFVKSALAKDIETIKLFDGITEMLKELTALGYTIGIVTSNNKSTVMKFLKLHAIEDYFKFVLAEKHLFGKHRAIKKAIDLYALDKAHTIYIGDEVRDIEATKKVDMAIISVDWGYNSRRLLESYFPTYLVSTPKEITNILSFKS